MQKMFVCKRGIAQIDALLNLNTHKEVISAKINKTMAVAVALQTNGYRRCVFKLSIVNYA
jgi:hypothetical protein